MPRRCLHQNGRRGGDEGPHKVAGREAKRGRRTEGPVSVEATMGSDVCSKVIYFNAAIFITIVGNNEAISV